MHDLEGKQLGFPDRRDIIAAVFCLPCFCFWCGSVCWRHSLWLALALLNGLCCVVLVHRRTSGHITMHWSAKGGTILKTASTAYGTRCQRSKEKRLVPSCASPARCSVLESEGCSLCTGNWQVVVMELVLFPYYYFIILNDVV